MFRRSIGPDAELALLEERHAGEVFRLADGDRARLRLWLPWVDGTLSSDDTREFIRRSLEQYEKGEGLVAGIWQQGRLAGVASFVGISPVNRSAMIGYWLAGEFEGRGLMTRACEALIDYGFGELGLNRIVIRAAIENKRSQAVPVRLGFTREGVERQAEWLNDHFLDMVVYSMLRNEWKAVKE
ncbi:MAG: ribosomal-protein-L7/L12-serine acetyltransferase [Methanocella sp. PtaU1.Bin125]|nr:MAG: ribosomal-protein-L7/L12-serine acetyltransferase [Methanocella sp. PtaU1.Bin125]